MTDLPQTTSFRNLSDAISPTGLQGPNGQKLRYSMAILYDAMADAGGYAVRFRFPNTAAADSLQWISIDRQIDRGPDEPTDSFVTRLIQWLDLWRNAGGAPAVLRALESYFIGFALVEGSAPITIETVKEAALGIATPINVWDVGPTDPPAHYEIAPPNWDWDGNNYPGRAWVIIFNGPWAQTPKWGAFEWGDGTTYGSNAKQGDGAALRGLVAKWKDAGCLVPQIIIAFDPAWFQSALPAGDPHLPDGTWGSWGKVVVVGGVRTRVRSRTSTAIYIGGVS